MGKRGRPRKHEWFSRKDLETTFSLHAQYLKWASANNVALQTLAARGCPECSDDSFELRHDRRHKIIRFHCFKCRYETSYRVKVPKPGSFEIVPVYENGFLVGEAIVDTYHPVTIRQRSDALVLNFCSGVESGRISLGGEWYVEHSTSGLRHQKRYYASFEEVMSICIWNRAQIEHERRLRNLEEDGVV